MLLSDEQPERFRQYPARPVCGTYPTVTAPQDCEPAACDLRKP
jgi:hypothetical protein